MSTRYNTGNPIESTDVRDMSDNAKNFDEFSVSTKHTFSDRLGVTRKTIRGMNAEFDYQILSMGFARVGTFATGATLTNPRQVLLWDIADGGDGQEYGWTGVFPNIVPAGSTPLTTGGIAVGAWMSRFDPEMRGQVREALRRSYAEAGYHLVNGSFEAGGTLVNANDVLLQERTGKAFSGPAGVVSAGTDPASGGFVDKSGGLLRHELATSNGATKVGTSDGGSVQDFIDAQTFANVNAMLSFVGLTVGQRYSTGGTTWKMVSKSDPVVIEDFEPITPVYAADFTKYQSDSQAFHDAVQFAAEKGKPCYINTKLDMTEKVIFTSPLVYKLYMHQGELSTTEDNFDFVDFEVTVERVIIRDISINGNKVAQRGIKVKCSCDIFGGEIKDFDSRLGDAPVSAYGINLDVPASKQVEMNVVNVDIKKILTRKDGSVGQSAGASRAIYASAVEQITGDWVSRVNIIGCSMSDIFGREGDILHIYNSQTEPDKVIFKVEDNRLIRSNRRNMKLIGHNIVLIRNYLETIDRNSDWYGLDGQGGACVIGFSSPVSGMYVEGCKMIDTEIVNKGGVKSHTAISNTKGFQSLRTTASLRGDTTWGISPFDILDGNRGVLFKDSEIEMSGTARITSSLTGDNKVKNVNFYGDVTNLRSWCEPNILDINLTVEDCSFSFPLSTTFLGVWFPNAGSVNHYVGLVALIRNIVYAPASSYGYVAFLNDKDVGNLVCLDNFKKRAGNPIDTNAGTVIGPGCVFRRNGSLTVEDQRPT